MSPRKRKPEYRIAVSYSLRRFQWGSLEEDARRIAKIDFDGAGTGFDRRDLSFYFPTLRRAQNATQRFRKDPRFRVDCEPELVD